jgi:vWA found in TerF C terminus
MSDNTLINLTKQVKITLEKREAPKIVTQVGVAFDISGSTQNFYTDSNRKGANSYIQQLLNRIFAIAVTFDDNEALNTWVFDDHSTQVEDIVKENYESYVDSFILNNDKIHKWGTTNGAGVITDINKYYNFSNENLSTFGKIKSLWSKKQTEEVKLSDPAYILLITDGEFDNDHLAEAAIKVTENERIFWQLTYLSTYPNTHKLLKKLSETYLNVSYDQISPLETDAILYDKLISKKFIDWYTTISK